MKKQLSRRSFIKKKGSAVALLSAGGGISAFGARGKKHKVPSSSETLVKTLYSSLNEEQHKAIVFSFDDPLRLDVDNNWHIVKPRVGSLFNADQQAMIREIFMKMHSEEYRKQVLHQFVSDNKNRKNPTEEAAFGSASVAIFGQPDSGKFEFVFTGRHCTRRCDGNSVEGAAFGGPIFYGHASGSFDEEPDHPGNVYWFQAKRANEVFQMLDGKQRAQALCGSGRKERKTQTVALSGKVEGLEGIAVSDMTHDQKSEVRKVLADLLAPFRREDREESMRLIEPQFDQLHMAFYKNQDVGNDGVWDVWQVEGPNMVWYFRGDPHVHTWVNIRAPA